MLTGTLIGLLEHAHSPRQVSAAVWALEKWTGVETKDVIHDYEQTYRDWYQRNGYYRIVGLYQNYTTHSGKNISFDVALESPAILAGTKIIAEDMGTLPFLVYRRSKDRDTTQKLYAHRLWRVLHDLVNPEVSASEFVEALTAHAILTGNGYAEIQTFASGVYLWPWQPQDVRIDRNKKGALFYLHNEGGTEKPYPREKVFHLRGFTLNGTKGDELLKRARHSIGLTLAADEYAQRYFANDATPGVVLFRDATAAGVPKPVGPDSVSAIKEAWKRWHQGLHMAHEPAVLQDGFKPMLLTPNAQEAQLLEARKYQVLEACRLLRLPPYKLADLDRAIQANIEQQSIDYIQFSLSPWQRRWRDAVYRCLLTEDERLEDRIYAEHLTEALQRGDFQTQSEGFRVLLEKGVYSINDVRRLLNLNPIDGGDEHFIQLNLGTVAEIAQGLNLPAASRPGATVQVPVKPTKQIEPPK